MGQTTNLGLATYDTASGSAVKFLEFRLALADVSSNMSIIDTAVGTLQTDIGVIRSNAVYSVNLTQATTNYYIGTVANLTSYTTGITVNFEIDVDNTGSVTVNINSIGVVTLKKSSGVGAKENLVSGNMVTGKRYTFVYDGTDFVAVSLVGVTPYVGESPIIISGSVISSSYVGSGPITVSGSVISSASGVVTSASYNKVLVDTYGRVTSGSQMVYVIPTGSITDGHMAIFSGSSGSIISDGGAPGTGGVSASGVIVSGHMAVFSGTSGSLIIDGGAPGTGAVSASGVIVSGHVAVFSGSSGSLIIDGGAPGIALTGASPIVTSGSYIFHADSGVLEGTYLSANVTVDEFGHITFIEAGVSASSVGAPSDSAFVTTASSVYLTNHSVIASGSNIQIVSASANGAPMYIHSTSSGSNDGWSSASESWTFASADTPTFTFNTSASNMQNTYSPGMKFRMTHNSSTKYFICTAIGGSTVTCYGGTDYILSSSAITNPYFSTSKAPYGFPLNPKKWTVTASSTAADYQTSPVSGTWYNLGSITISIPIGSWDVSYCGNLYVARTGNGAVSIYSTLSTANNSESDVELTGALYASNTTQSTSRVYVEKILQIASKTSYYLNSKTATAAMDEIDFRGDFSPTMIHALCTYL